MRFGIHLPQFGRAAVAGGVEQAARSAEEFGFDDVWVSDHLVIPKDQPYPSPYLYDPLVSLSFAASATSTIGLGTSVLVVPQYTSPLALANTLATLDNMSQGRLIVGVGIGWSQAEYKALHAPFDHRGARIDEIIDLFRTVWRDDPASHEGP
jgi:alkanesulfonate monooxygenase SsuD/methylene tetrahydromethanopterin reductase-like flavin-dependent oxidoreductase (luciferase family)